MFTDSIVVVDVAAFQTADLRVTLDDYRSQLIYSIDFNFSLSVAHAVQLIYCVINEIECGIRDELPVDIISEAKVAALKP